MSNVTSIGGKAASKELLAASRLIQLDLGGPDYFIRKPDLSGIPVSKELLRGETEEVLFAHRLCIARSRISKAVIRALVISAYAPTREQPNKAMGFNDSKIYGAWQEILDDDDIVGVVEIPRKQLDWMRKFLVDNAVGLHPEMASFRVTLALYLDESEKIAQEEEAPV